MPNGGPDCCGNCGFNRAVQEMAHPHPDQRERFWALSHCTLRDLKITDPFWTYCENFRYGKLLPGAEDYERPVGWVYSSGLYEGYVRIPWHDDAGPRVSEPCSCAVCGRATDRGIKVLDAGAEIGFCTNRHYVDWWKTRHDDPTVSSEGLEEPETFFRRST